MPQNFIEMLDQLAAEANPPLGDQDLAVLLGVTRQHIHAVRSGKQDLSPQEKMKVINRCAANTA